MTQREAAIHQLKALKGKSLRAKAEHILTYYWLHLVTVAAVIAIVVSSVYYLATEKDTALNVTCLDAAASAADKQSFVQGFAQAAGIDTEKYTVEIVADQMDTDSDLGAYEGEVLAAQIVAETIDVLAMNAETANQWLYQDVFADLSELFSQEQLARYEGSLLYVDAAVLQRIEELDDSQGEITYPDPTKPEEMEDPVPVMIRLDPDSAFSSLYFVGEENVVLGILGNAANVENALLFLEYLMD